MKTRHPQDLRQQFLGSSAAPRPQETAIEEPGLPADLGRFRVLSRKQLAAMTGLSEVTHERLDACGDGPRMIRLSARRVGYRLGDVLDWLDQRAATTNTAA